MKCRNFFVMSVCLMVLLVSLFNFQVVQAVPPATELWSSDSSGNVKDVFIFVESVYVTVTGIAQTVSFYVVEPSLTDGDVLVDISDGVETLFIDSLVHGKTVMIWVPLLDFGEYCVVLDVEMDGVYDEDLDATDGFLVTADGSDRSLWCSDFDGNITSKPNPMVIKEFFPYEGVYATVKEIGQTVSLYVVEQPLTDGDVLVDVSGGVETLFLSGYRYRTIKVWSPGLDLGDYYVVVDVDMDGVYDSELDFKDNFVVWTPNLIAKLWSSDVSGNEKEVFISHENVYANVTTIGQKVSFYIVDDPSLNDGDVLVDFSDGVETLLLDFNYYLTQIVRIWVPELDVGDHYIVMDVDADGIFDSQLDLIDHFSVIPTLNTIPEVPLGTIVSFVAMGFALFCFFFIKRIQTKKS